jgi:hypothetical protein
VRAHSVGLAALAALAALATLATLATLAALAALAATGPWDTPPHAAACLAQRVPRCASFVHPSRPQARFQECLSLARTEHFHLHGTFGSYLDTPT